MLDEISKTIAGIAPILLPVVTLVLGILLQSRIDARRSQEQRSHEAQLADKRMKAERVKELEVQQVDYLLEIQEVAAKLIRNTQQIILHDKNVLRETGKWAQPGLPDELSDGAFWVNRRLAILMVRVQSPEIRKSIEEIKSLYDRACLTADLREANEIESQLTSKFNALNERAGELIRVT